MATLYPNKVEMRSMAQNMATGNFEAFFSNVTDGVDWMIIGHHPFAGHYTAKEDFMRRTLKRLPTTMAPDQSMKMDFINVVGGGVEA
ncbi:MAG: hypothetical protein M1827_001721 [Pycnora praestabilis]|nr:MAG: hypothetical protein M1827_001721 [Pycnora praestabilis]